MNQLSTYKQRTLETNKALQANIAAGGERARHTRHALNIADVVNFWNQAGSDIAFNRELNRYKSYCERIGFDPMEDMPN
jgi:hypothetical protein